MVYLVDLSGHLVVVALLSWSPKSTLSTYCPVSSRAEEFRELSKAAFGLLVVVAFGLLVFVVATSMVVFFV